ncbi:MAG: hypothetical protein RLZZ226_415 [Pseudomonadota bacterium]
MMPPYTSIEYATRILKEFGYNGIKTARTMYGEREAGCHTKTRDPFPARCGENYVAKIKGEPG